ETKTILGKLFDKQRTYCGAMKPEQTAFLFPASTDTIASTAMVPIHINTGDKRSAGFKAIPVLVLASSSSNHFNNNQDTLFLDFIGEVLSALIVHLR
ncbi:MAG: DUF484 family protein, partial [Pseudohongiellaceae bacterium]